jgi:hypothetical protein
MTWTNRRVTRGMTWQVRTWDTWQHQGVPRGMLIWHFWQANGQYQGDTCHHSQGDTWHQVTSSLTWHHGRATRGLYGGLRGNRWTNQIATRVKFRLVKKGAPRGPLRGSHVAPHGWWLVSACYVVPWFRWRCWHGFHGTQGSVTPPRTGFISHVATGHIHGCRSGTRSYHGGAGGYNMEPRFNMQGYTDPGQGPREPGR